MNKTFQNTNFKLNNMISPKQRNCKICKCSMVSNETTCQECKRKKKAEAKKDKPLLTQDEINALKVAKTIKPKKEPQNQKELDKIKLEKKKIRTKNIKDKKKSEKLISMTNLFTLYQKFIRLVTPDICSSCNCVVGEHGRQKQGGHCHPKGKYKSTSLLVTNIFSQCNVCNSPYGGNGMLLDLYNYGCKFWGKETMDLVHKMTKISYSFNKAERQEMYEYITLKIKEAEKIELQKNKTYLLKEVWYWQQDQQWFINIINQI